MSKIFEWLGLSPTEEDKKISLMIKNGYPTKVVGRGTVMVDESAILNDENFKKLRLRAKKIVSSQSAKAA
jgi:hypothetical protein